MEGCSDRDWLVSLTCSIVWRIWKCRNRVVFSSKTCDYNTAVNLTVKDSDEFLDAQDCENHESGNTGDGSHAGVRDWCPPMNGRLKLNFDAGV